MKKLSREKGCKREILYACARNFIFLKGILFLMMILGGLVFSNFVANATVTSLGDAFPNPFYSETIIPYALAKTGEVKIAIYNVFGEEVATLVDGRKEAGNHWVVWDALGFWVGKYTYKMKTTGFSEVKEVVLFWSTPTSPPPTAPTSVTVSPVANNCKALSISWSGATGTITGYRVWRTTPGFDGWSEISDLWGTTGTTFINSGLTGGETYNYYVKAYNASGSSPESPHASGTTIVCISTMSTPPTAPTSVTVSPVANNCKALSISWSGATGVITGYRVWRTSPGFSGWSEISDLWGTTGTTFINSGLTGGETYNYYVKAYNASGLSPESPHASGTTVVCISTGDAFPNPFNSATTVLYALTKAGDVKIIIYNLAGQKVATLVDGREEAGKHSVVWNASQFPSGMYFYTMQAEGFTEKKKLVLLK